MQIKQSIRSDGAPRDGGRWAYSYLILILENIDAAYGSARIHAAVMDYWMVVQWHDNWLQAGPITLWSNGRGETI